MLVVGRDAILKEESLVEGSVVVVAVVAVTAWIGLVVVIAGCSHCNMIEAMD